MRRVTTVYIVFEGVIALDSEYVEVDTMDDVTPTNGSIQWLNSLCVSDKFDIIVGVSNPAMSTSNIGKWLVDNGFSKNNLNKILFTRRLEAHDVLISPKAFQFNGQFPVLERMQRFYPWPDPRRAA